MIRVRDDDILGCSDQWAIEGKPGVGEFGRFKQLHEWIQGHPDFVHVCTIVTSALAEIPQAIEYMKPEVEAGRIIPEIHGVEHIDYGKESKERVYSDLEYCKDWIEEQFGYTPTRWYTPWGASQPHLWEVAAECQLQLVDVDTPLPGGFRGAKHNSLPQVARRLRFGEPIDILYNEFQVDEIFMHWWEAGARLARVVESVKCGSWADAERLNRKLFK